MPRNYVKTIRLNRIENEIIEELAHNLRVSEAEVFRRLLWTVRTIFSSYLPARQAIANVVDNGHEPSLADMLKPVPELMNIILTEMERKKVFDSENLRMKGEKTE